MASASVPPPGNRARHSGDCHDRTWRRAACRQGDELGATDFVEKPFDGDALVKVLISALMPESSVSAKDAISGELLSRLASLSQRESQILKGLVNGQTNKEIARNSI